MTPRLHAAEARSAAERAEAGDWRGMFDDGVMLRFGAGCSVCLRQMGGRYAINPSQPRRRAAEQQSAESQNSQDSTVCIANICTP